MTSRSFDLARLLRDSSTTSAATTNTANAIVARDASGNFSAGTVTATLSGNASTATTLQTARTIAISGDVTGTATSFNGGANISISSAITAGVIVNADINASAAISDTKLATISTAGKVSNSATTATSANTASAIVARDASGNFSAGSITVSGTVDGRDLAADGTKLDGIESGATADQTAAEILAALVTVDGASSGLDADLLDGQDGSYYSRSTEGYYYIVGTGTVAGTWTGSHAAISSYYEGLQISFYMNIAGASTTTVNINGLGAKTVYLYGAAKLTTHYPAGTVLNLTYTAANGGSFNCTMYYDTTDDYRIRWQNNITAGTTIHGYQLLHEGMDGKFYPVTEGGVAGTTNTVSTAELKLGGAILYYDTSTDIAANASGGAYYLYESYYTSTLEYWSNRNLTDWATLGQPVYLVGTINASGAFILDNTNYTSFLTQTLPTTEDGKVYVQVGIMLNTTDAMRTYINKPIFEYKDGAIRSYSYSRTPSLLLTDIKTVDGAASGLDADLLDGNHASAFSLTTHDHTGLLKRAVIPTGADLNTYTTDGYYHQTSNANAAAGTNYPVSLAGMLEVMADGAMVYQRYTVYDSTHDMYVRTYYNGTWNLWNKLWNHRNDGSGSGLDADLLDGNHATAFYLATNPSGYTTNTGTVTSVSATVPTGFSVSGSPVTTSGTLGITYSAGYQGYTTTEASKLAGIESGATADQTAAEILTAIKTVDGAASGLDADLLDGNHATAFYLATNPSGYTTNTGTVTSVATSGAITGGTITTTGTISHSTADGYLHVPATGTTNNGKVLTAGATAGSLSWATPTTGTVTSIVAGSYLTGGTITTSGTIAVDATTANTASKIVARDASGNFSAGTITATLSGNASTATTLQTARTIAISGDVTGTATSFNGSANISISAAITAGSIVSADFNNKASLIIYNSAGTALKTIYSPGS